MTTYMASALGSAPSHQTPTINTNTTWTPKTVRLYEQHFDALTCVAQRLLRDWSLAQDCVQDVFVAYATKNVRPMPGCEYGYLRTMVRNAAISMIRKEARTESCAEVDVGKSVHSTEDIVIALVTAGLIEGELESLSSRQYEVVDCRRRGMSVDETADELSVSPGTVKTHRFRAAATLHDVVQDVIAA